MSGHVDGETPLLTGNRKKQPTPLPWFQFSLLLFLQLAEPLTSYVISPFAPQLIRDLGITHGNESKVGYYVGLMLSLFFLTQALHWSRISDRIGRKPIILSGLFGLSISMFCFGLSKTFWSLVLSRCLSGALNGNIGVIKSMMAEMTDATNISKAYSYMPISWSTFTGLSYGAIFIFITASSPNRASLGATNGLRQMSVSIMRAVGPATATSLFSLSIEKGYLGGYFVYYALVSATGAALVFGLMLPRKLWTNENHEHEQL